MREELKASGSRLALVVSLGVIAAVGLPSNAAAQTVCIPLLRATSCTATGPLPPAALPSTVMPLQITVAPTPALTGGLADATLNSLTVRAQGAISTATPNQPALMLTAGTLVDATAGRLTTTGNDADGADLVSLAGPATLNASGIATAGDRSDGALIRAAGSINLAADVVQTSGARALGLDLATNPTACVALGAGACSINGTVGSLTTNGAGSLGVLADAAGPTNLHLDALQTGGADAAGLDLASDPAACAVLGKGNCGTAFTVGKLLTQGDRSPGILATIAGPTSGSVGLLQTGGANAPGLALTGDPTACVLLGVGGCNTQVAVDQLRTAGANSAGVLLNAPATLSAQLGSVVTQGDNAPGASLITNPAACLVLGVGGCGATLTAGSIGTGGANSPAIGVLAAGPVAVNATDLATNGINSPGIAVATDPAACAVLGAGSCGTSIGAGTVRTGGNGSTGIGVTGAVPVAIDTDRVTTAGADAPGISVTTTPAVCAVLGVGACGTGITAGSVTTAGDRSSGIVAKGAGPTAIKVDSVSTAGLNAPAISVAADPTACLTLGVAACSTSINAGTLTTGGDGADGIGVSGAGPITIGVGQVTTAGANAPGIATSLNPAVCAVLGSGNCGTAITAGSVTTGGNGSPGIGVLGSGPVSVVTGSVSTAGQNAPGVSVATDPTACLVVANGLCPTTVTTGPVQTGGNNSPGVGITVAGPTTITTGTITTIGTGSPGLSVTIDPVLCATLGAGSCATNVSTGGISTGGGSGGIVVSGGAGGNGGGGTGTGPVNTGAIAIGAGPIGSGGNGIDVNVGCQDVAIIARGPITAGGTGIVAQSQCGVRVTTLAGAPVQGATGGISVTAGTNAVVTVGDRLSAGNGLALNSKGAGVTVVNQPTGAIVGRLDLTDNADQFTNAGRFEAVGDSNFGGGTDLLVNQGVIAVRPAAAKAGSVTFAGLETLNNSGTIDMRNGQVGDRLEVPGSFVGTGASTLGVDVGAGITSDRLIVGGAATGSTRVFAAGLTGALVNGAVIVDAGAGTSPTAFVLAGGIQRVGLTDYALAYDAGSNDFALYGTPGQVAVTPIALADALRQTFYRSSDAVAAHLDAAPTSRALWAVSFGAVDNRRAGVAATPFGQARTYDLSSREDWFGFQGGLDLPVGGRALVGVTLGYANSRLTMSSDPSRFLIETVNAGGYARIATGPFRLDALGKYEYAWVGFQNAASGIGARLHPNSYGGRAQASVVVGSRRVSIQPFASFDYAHVDHRDLAIGRFAESVDVANGLRGKAGARVDLVVADRASRVSLYASGAAVHEFADRDRLMIADGDGSALALLAPVVPTYAQLRAGFDIVQGASVHGFIEGVADASGGYRGGGGRAGLSVRF